MIITREMFDEFVESAENHTILWTDTLALIGVTVGDVPDVDVIEAQAAEIARLREALDWAIAEIEGRTIYPGSDQFTSEQQFENALEAARAALAQETQP